MKKILSLILILLSIHCNIFADITITGISQMSGASTAFSENTIENLGAWFDLADSSTVSTSGNNITQIDDKSGNGKHATQATGDNQPTYTNQINGRNVATFTTDDYMTSTMNIDYATNPNVTIIAVYQKTSSDGNDALWGQDDSNFDRFYLTNYISTGAQLSTGSALLAYPDAGGVNNLEISTVIMQNGVSNGSFSYLNKTLKNTFTESHGNSGDSVLSIGSIGSAAMADYYFNGHLCEMLVFTSKPSDVDLNIAWDYLISKDGVSV
ncbi:MAG: hypothetical protein ACFFG0_03430 [Candidatus Thorarchaeota archaeon]